MGVLAAITRPITEPIRRMIKAELARDTTPRGRVRQPYAWDVPLGPRMPTTATYREGRPITFGTLRAVSELHVPTRACIWARINQVQSVKWEIGGRDEAKPSDATLKSARDYFATTGGLGGRRTRFRRFLAMAVEDLLALDALAIYKRPNRGGGLFAHEIIDPTTIKPLVDAKGFRPTPPAPAYQQFVGGRPGQTWTDDEMYYEMLRPRSMSPYGLSPVECMMTVVESYLRAEMWNLDWLDKGTIPAGLFYVPKEWTPDQVKAFMEDYWRPMLQGDPAMRQSLMAVPGEKGAVQIFQNRSDMQYEELERWLLALTCALFGMSPAVLGFAGETYKYSQEDQIAMARVWGLEPLLLLLKELLDDFIQDDLGLDELEFRWLGLEEEDLRLQAEIDDRYVAAGLMTRNEVRSERGLEPVKGGYADKLTVITAGGPVSLGDTTQELPDPDDEEEQRDADDAESVGGNGAGLRSQRQGGQTPGEAEAEQAGPEGAVEGQARKVNKELSQWRSAALHDLKRKGHVCAFACHEIVAKQATEIGEELSKATDAEAVKHVFEKAKMRAKQIRNPEDLSINRRFSELLAERVLDEVWPESQETAGVGA